MEKTEKYTELQLKHQNQLKQNRLKEKERRARVHRLIVRGAIVESFIPNSEQMSDTEFQDELAFRLKRYKELEEQINADLR